MSRYTLLVFFSRFITIPSRRFFSIDGAFSFNSVMPLSYEWRYTKDSFLREISKTKTIEFTPL